MKTRKSKLPEHKSRLTAAKRAKLRSLAIAGINAAMELASDTARKWYVDPKTGKPIERNFGEVIALMHSELSEALEADRKDLMDDKLPDRKGVEVEFADAVLRIFDTAKHKGFDLAGAIVAKDQYNLTRQDHRLEARRAKNGKRY